MPAKLPDDLFSLKETRLVGICGQCSKDTRVKVFFGGYVCKGCLNAFHDNDKVDVDIPSTKCKEDHCGINFPTMLALENHAKRCH